jgi:hypothetical protein
MPRLTIFGLLAVVCGVMLFPVGAGASPITLFSTGSPDGKIATKSGPASATASRETETADDFVLGQDALVTNATLIGLLPLGTSLNTITDVEIELYHVFPLDSAFPPDGRVLTRVNSPSDNEFAAFDSADGSLTFSATLLSSPFTALNSVVNGINASPNQFTGGEGQVTGEEVQINITFTTPFFVGAADHDFFRPEVGISGSGNFLWLSAPRAIIAPGNPLQFPAGTTDLQSWIRNDGAGGLAPDWSRIGTDITNQGPFNAAFSLVGDPVAEPASLLLLSTGLLAAGRFWKQPRTDCRPRR